MTATIDHATTDYERRIPAGNARVGDRVCLRPRPSADWEDGWTVMRLGIVNDAGYPLDVEIKRGDRRMVVSPFLSGVDLAYPGSLHSDRPVVLILPPDRELPESLVETTALYTDLTVIRYPNNGDIPGYRLLCRRCLFPLWAELTSRESAELTWRAGEDRHAASNPCVEDGEVQARCQCQPYPWLTIDLDHLHG
ncbi:MAG: hypothetical protein AB7I30_05615 [Isosphaeraceae bacterium]